MALITLLRTMLFSYILAIFPLITDFASADSSSPSLLAASGSEVGESCTCSCPVAESKDQGPPAQVSQTDAFDFGKNWLSFLQSLLEPEGRPSVARTHYVYSGGSDIDEGRPKMIRRVETFMALIQEKYGVISLTGLTFIDVGAGHGLASLAAVRLNASIVISMDIDARPVRELRRVVSSNLSLGLTVDPWQTWDVIDGSVLNQIFITSDVLPRADLVWSYGVLHHTGDVRLGLQHIGKLLKPIGLAYIEFHTADETPFRNDWLEFKSKWKSSPAAYKQEALMAYIMSEMWDDLKKSNHLERMTQTFPHHHDKPGFFGRFYVMQEILHGRFWEYSLGRGMDFVSDALDWLGGFPYEWLKIDEVVEVFQNMAPPLSVLSASWDGLSGFLLTPSQPGEDWHSALTTIRWELKPLLSDTKQPGGAIWAQRILSPLTIMGSMKEVCPHEPKLCGDGLGLVPEIDDAVVETCWIGAIPKRWKDSPIELLLFENGHLMGWGGAAEAVCSPILGRNFKILVLEVNVIVLFHLPKGESPFDNGHSYAVLAPVSN